MEEKVTKLEQENPKKMVIERDDKEVNIKNLREENTALQKKNEQLVAANRNLVAAIEKLKNVIVSKELEEFDRKSQFRQPPPQAPSN